MQDTVSTQLSAEHNQLLWHNHTEGRGLAVAQAAHLHLPHITQMIESDTGAGAGGDEVEALSDTDVVAALLQWFEEKGGVVITDTELVWRPGTGGDTGDTVTGLVRLLTLVGKDWQGLMSFVARPGGPGVLKGVSTYKFWARDAALRGLVRVIGDGAGSRELRAVGSWSETGVSTGTWCPLPGPEAGLEVDTGGGGGGPMREDSGLGGGVGGGCEPASLWAEPGPCLRGSGGSLTWANVEDEELASLCISRPGTNDSWHQCHCPNKNHVKNFAAGGGHVTCHVTRVCWVTQSPGMLTKFLFHTHFKLSESKHHLSIVQNSIHLSPEAQSSSYYFLLLLALHW